MAKNNLSNYLFCLEGIHFPLWIIKDASWFAALHFVSHKIIFQSISVFFAVTTIAITYLLIKTASTSLKKFEYTLLGFWLCANTSWMISELYSLEMLLVTVLFFSLGLLGAFPYLSQLFRQ